MLGRQQPFGSLLVAAGVILLGLTGTADAAYRGGEPLDLPVDKGLAGTFALEGEFVHNVGELQMNITNWGLIGSRPGTGALYSDAPSAMWPAGSGIEYLWAAGLWVGALKNGVPLVTTGQFTPEMLANPDDPLDTVWPTYQGAPGGKRYPDPGEDDDGDGLIDEPADKSTYPVAFIYIDGRPRAEIRDWRFSAFAQDSWQVTPGFLLDYGLRYELSTFTLPSQVDFSFSNRFGLF